MKLKDIDIKCHLQHSLTLTCIIENFHSLLSYLEPISSLEMDQSESRFIF